MPNNAAETVIGASGSVWIAPVGTAFPATVATVPAGPWVDLGFLTEDGVKFKPSQTTVEFRAWQSYYPIRTRITEKGLGISFAMKQWNEVTLPLAFGGGAVTGAGPFLYTPDSIATDLMEKALLVRWLDGIRRYDLRVSRVSPTDPSEAALMRSTIADLAVALTMKDDGDDATAPWTLLTDDPAFA